MDYSVIQTASEEHLAHYRLGRKINKLIESHKIYYVFVSRGHDFQSYGLRINSDDGQVNIGTLWLINRDIGASLDSLVLQFDRQEKADALKPLIEEIKRDIGREIRIAVGMNLGNIVFQV